jgi:hypothetical protein
MRKKFWSYMVQCLDTWLFGIKGNVNNLYITQTLNILEVPQGVQEEEESSIDRSHPHRGMYRDQGQQFGTFMHAGV